MDPNPTHRQGKEVLTLQRRRPSIQRGIVVQTHTTSRADTHHVSSPKQSVLEPDRHSHGPIVVPRIYLCASPLGKPPLGKNWPEARQTVTCSDDAHVQHMTRHTQRPITLHSVAMCSPGVTRNAVCGVSTSYIPQFHKGWRRAVV